MSLEVKQAREALYDAIALIEKTGLSAPAGASISLYSVSKEQKDGTKVQHQYYRLETEMPYFQGGKTGKTKFLHLGKAGSDKYQDWRGRIARRNLKSAIAWAMQELAVLEEMISDAEDS